jgi:hypothetical protein
MLLGVPNFAERSPVDRFTVISTVSNQQLRTPTEHISTWSIGQSLFRHSNPLDLEYHPQEYPQTYTALSSYMNGLVGS